jgi:hypothetical protein
LRSQHVGCHSRPRGNITTNICIRNFCRRTQVSLMRASSSSKTSA